LNSATNVQILVKIGSNATAANNSNFFGENAGYSATTANNSNFFGNQVVIKATGKFLSNFMVESWL
jgi:hypothetical protein